MKTLPKLIFMQTTNAQRQASYRSRMRKKGFVHLQEWVTVEQAQMIRLILAGAATATPAPASSRAKRRKKLSAADEDALRLRAINSGVIEQYRKQIDKMEKARASRSEIRTYLEAHGADFGGKTTELNAYLGRRAA